LLKVTADGFGLRRTTVLAQPFNSLFEMSAESPPQICLMSHAKELSEPSFYTAVQNNR
jgi:hypothetical protein